jgi:hypothetical protein
VGSGTSQRTKTAFMERAPSLTGHVREKEAPECLGEVAVIEQGSKLGGDVAADVQRCRCDLAHHLRRPSDHSDDVLEMVARGEHGMHPRSKWPLTVTLTAAMPPQSRGLV